MIRVQRISSSSLLLCLIMLACGSNGDDFTDASPHDGSSSDGPSSKDGSSKDGSFQDGSLKDASTQDASTQDASKADSSSSDGSSSDSSSSDGSLPDGSSSDASDGGANCALPTTAMLKFGYGTLNVTATTSTTLIVGGGYHVHGAISLASLPAGATLDATDSFGSFYNAKGETYTATITAGSATSLNYDAIVPAGTFSFDWGYVVQFSGGQLLGHQEVVSNLTVCGDQLLNQTVPSFGTLVAATANVSNLTAFGAPPDGSFDVYVQVSDANATTFAQAGTFGVTGSSAPAITLFVPSTAAVTPRVLVTSPDLTGTPNAGDFETRVEFAPEAAGASTYNLAIPAVSSISGSLTATSDVNNSYLPYFECDDPGLGPYYEITDAVLISNAFQAYYRTGGSCMPYTGVPVIMGVNSVNENSAAVLDVPTPTPASAITVSGPVALSAVAVPSIAPGNVTIYGSLTNASAAPLPNYNITARSISLTAAGFTKDRLRLEGGSPFSVVTDASGQFTLHVLTGDYSLLATP